MTHRVLISQKKQDGCNIYATMKTMCPPGVITINGFVATHALGHMMYVHHVRAFISKVTPELSPVTFSQYTTYLK